MCVHAMPQREECAVQFGLIVQMTGALGYPRPLVRLAQEAETAGWDGFFIWDVFGGAPDAPEPVVDPWIALAAIAATTKRIRFGPMVTPLPRRRPWKLAREAASLDHLSGGRLILGVGIGTPPEEFARFGEEPDPRIRAEMLDEGLEVLTGLWSGAPYSFQGRHYQVEETVLLPRPIQQPRIPIWVGGTWPRKPPFRRAARWDGVFPGGLHGNLTLDEIREMVGFIRSERPLAEPIDVMVGGDVPFDDPAGARAILAEYVAAGVTWWTEGIGEWRGDVDAMAAFIRGGPPGR
jgi:alkanesulfonate monooxygenase SsuD/methylene tetrahydromethanopterin reductase-like flavin-dependent oxidoreductase (luciferase family)